MGAFMSDNGPIDQPYCAETSATMPSVLFREQQQQLIGGAAACCRSLGLHTGVFNVEMMLTAQGPRLIEVNARMGGSYRRYWIRLVYGVDLLHVALMCACGVRPVLTGANSLDDEEERHVTIMEERTCKERTMTGREKVMGIQLYSSRHQHALASSATPDRLRRMHEQGHVIFTQFDEHVKQRDIAFKQSFANVAVKATSFAEARAKLTSVCIDLGLETKKRLDEILQGFTNLQL